MTLLIMMTTSCSN